MVLKTSQITRILTFSAIKQIKVVDDNAKCGKVLIMYHKMLFKTTQFPTNFNHGEGFGRFKKWSLQQCF